MKLLKHIFLSACALFALFGATLGHAQTQTTLSLPLILSNDGYTYTTLVLENDSALTFTLTAPAASYYSNDRAWVAIIDHNRAMEKDRGDYGYLNTVWDDTWWLANDNGTAKTTILPLQAGTYSVRAKGNFYAIQSPAYATLSIGVRESPNNDSGEYNDQNSAAVSLGAGGQQTATLGYRYVSNFTGKAEANPDVLDTYTFTAPEDGTVSYALNVIDINLPFHNSALSAYINGFDSTTYFKETGSQTSGPHTVYAGRSYYLYVKSSNGAYGSYTLTQTFTSKTATACSSTNLSACTSLAACTTASGYWNFDWCGAQPQDDPSHHATYCEQGYTQFCDTTGTPNTDNGSSTTDRITDWVSRSDVVYQSVATVVQDTANQTWRLNGGAWSNGRANSSGEHDGNGIQSRATYNFVGKKTYAAFQLHGAGQYAAWYVKPWYLPLGHFNTHHSFSNGLLLGEDATIYVTYDIAATGAWSVSMATGNYAESGGSVVHSTSGTLTGTQLSQLADAPFLVTFTDNYAGTAAYMILNEVRIGGTTDTPTEPVASVQADCLFNWAEHNFPALFAPAGANSQTFGEYYLRYYSGTNSYLATYNGERLAYLGPLSTGEILDLGSLSAWLSPAGCQ